jgi:hypothetical protein
MTYRRAARPCSDSHACPIVDDISSSSCDSMARGIYTMEARIMASHKKARRARDVVSATYSIVIARNPQPSSEDATIWRDSGINHNGATVVLIPSTRPGPGKILLRRVYTGFHASFFSVLTKVCTIETNAGENLMGNVEHLESPATVKPMNRVTPCYTTVASAARKTEMRLTSMALHGRLYIQIQLQTA